MKKRFLHTCLLITACTAGAVPARALDCSVTFEVIQAMHDPHMGSFNIWDNVYGENEATERFRSAISIAGNQVLAVGEKTPAGGKTQLVFATFDHRGRVTKEKMYEITGLKNVVKMVPQGDGALVMASVEIAGSAQIWIGIFDSDSSLLSHKTISDRAGRLYGHDIISLEESGDYLVAASVETPKSGSYTQFYRLDPDAKVMFERAYRPGLDNRVGALTRQGDGHYMGAGSMKTADGREQGWLVMIDTQGNIAWERAYPYGLSGKLTGITAYDDTHVALVGDILEDGAKYRTGWAMMADATTGEITWQRRYRGRSSWFARNIMRSGDKISVLFDTAASRDDRQEYARLLTLDSRGLLVDDKGYFNGAGARASQLVAGHNGSRVLVGETDTVIPAPKAGPEPPPARTLQGWLVAGEPVSTAVDRCASMNRR